MYATCTIFIISLPSHLPLSQEELGLSPSALVKVVSRSPQLMAQNIASGVAPRIAFLRGALMLPRDSVASMITR